MPVDLPAYGVQHNRAQGARLRSAPSSPLDCPGQPRRVKGAYGVASRSASLTLDAPALPWGVAATRRGQCRGRPTRRCPGRVCCRGKDQSACPLRARSGGEARGIGVVQGERDRASDLGLRSLIKITTAIFKQAVRSSNLSHPQRSPLINGSWMQGWSSSANAGRWRPD